MRATFKIAGIAVLFLLALIYGYLISAKRLFPFPQLMELKHYIEYSRGTFEYRKPASQPDSIEIINTAMERLLVTKISIPDFVGYGGGISAAGNLLIIVTNKGSIHILDLATNSVIKNTISEVPLHFKDLILSGLPYKTDFSIPRFRVNGVYAETKDSSNYSLFISHNAYNAGKKCITHNLSRVDFGLKPDGSISQQSQWRTLFSANPCIYPTSGKMPSTKEYEGHISGGAIAQYDSTRLLVTVGDYDHNGLKNTREFSMSPSLLFGKFVLVDKNSGRWSVYASGSRNATGLVIESDSVVWSVENGPRGGDELNRVYEGENYGWPRVSYGIWYDPAISLPGNQKAGTHPGYRKPVFSWVPSVAPSSLIQVNGNRFEYWKGDLLMGTMRDQSLHRLRLNENKRVEYDEKIHIGHRIRDMIQLKDGRISLITDDGYLYLIDTGGSVFESLDRQGIAKMKLLEELDFGTDGIPPKNGLKAGNQSARAIFQLKCASCHNLAPRNQIGPHLHNLFGRTVGSLSNYAYSNAMEQDKRSWNTHLLKKYLKNPDKVIPGTRMPDVILNKDQIDSLAQFFRSKKWVQ